MNRRKFLRNLIYSAGGILIAEELIPLVNRTYFLPPINKYSYWMSVDLAYGGDLTVYSIWENGILLSITKEFCIPTRYLRRISDGSHRRGSEEIVVPAMSTSRRDGSNVI